MKFSSNLRKQIGNTWSHFDPFSLQVRLSVGIASRLCCRIEQRCRLDDVANAANPN